MKNQSTVNEINQASDPPSSSARSEWMSAAYFLLGVLVGVVGILVFNGLTAKPGFDPISVQQASRNGVLEALATLQASNQNAVAENVVPGTPEPTPAVSQTAFALREQNRKGAKNAPITIVEFSDFQCPFCRRAFQEVLPPLVQEYVDSGRVTLVYKHSAFLGQESTWAAVASECAADQGKFWDYHDLLFSRQAGENQGAFNKDKLLGFAKKLELDMAKFEPCLTNDQTLARVQADVQEGQRAGVTGTPTFFINGQKMAGAQPYEQFRAVIEPLLTSAQ